ncbi:MAG: hypothetical protein ACREDP_16250 [Bradyrhizobium sp.]
MLKTMPYKVIINLEAGPNGAQLKTRFNLTSQPYWTSAKFFGGLREMSSSLPISPSIVLSYHLTFRAIVLLLRSVMLDKEFKKQRAQTVRELAEKANDPFIKARLLDLVSRYEDRRSSTPLTPVDLEFAGQGTGTCGCRT